MTTSTDLTAIRLDEFLPHPPETVWRALVDPDRLAKWLGPNDFKPEVGHRFQIQGQPIPSVGFSGVVQCEVLELRPLELLRLQANSRGAPLGSEPRRIDARDEQSHDGER